MEKSGMKVMLQKKKKFFDNFHDSKNTEMLNFVYFIIHSSVFITQYE